MNLKVPQRFESAEFEVKKSRFIAWAVPVTSRQEAMQWVNRAREEFPDARHHCWAYQLGDSAVATHAAANDDGEPSGTAGRPILSVIQHKNIGNVLVIVIRYFGGVKLGAGGLVRAYSGATELVLSTLPVQTPVLMTHARVSCEFAHEQIIRHFSEQHQAQVLNVEYSQHVRIRIELPTEHAPAFESLCASLGAHVEFNVD